MTMKLKVGVVGGGSWGTTVASLASRHSSTMIWARNPDTVNEINQFHTNKKYLGNSKLFPLLVASNSIEEVVSQADVVIMGVPAQSFRKVLLDAKPHIRPWVPIISLSKGLERGTKHRAARGQPHQVQWAHPDSQGQPGARGSRGQDHWQRGAVLFGNGERL